MVDIHTHILPGIDDGAKEIKQSLIMIGEAYSAGFTDIITTSHYMANVYEADKNERQRLISELKEYLKKLELSTNLYNGAEIYFSEDFPEQVEQGIIPTLADSQYVLFEIPLNKKVTYIDSSIFKLKKMGYIPIIAHPERYVIVQEDINIARDWVECGALLQSNFGSAINFYGRNAKKTFYKLLKNDLVSFLGSDNHRENQIYYAMPKIKKILERKLGKAKFEELTEINPRKIIEHEKWL